MESLVGQHDTVLAIKEFPVFVTIKVENEEEEQQRSHYIETTESNVYIKSEEVNMKLGEMHCESINALKKEYLGSEIEGDFNGIDNLKEEGIDIDDNQIGLKNEANTEVAETALLSIPVAVLSSNPGGHTSSTFEKYPHVSKYSPNQEKRKLSKKKKTRKPLLKCEQCSYEAKYISNFHLHMRIHKDPSELDMYKCAHCDFKTKHKSSLKQHSILHKDKVDIPRYKCNSCDFESKRKGALIRHVRCHQNTPENVLKCEQCFYKCNFPSRLSSHMRVHKDPSELDMHECTQCNFKTKHKWNLKAHSILHKDAAHVPKYKCSSCDFESNRNNALRRHIRWHQKTLGVYIQMPQKMPPKNTNNSKKRVLKCEQCFYECNFPSRLHSHMLVHKDPSEINMYECTQCNFKTKHKTSLRDHSILHKHVADIPRYKCNSCDLETSRKGTLIRHIRRRHKKNVETTSKDIFLDTKAQP